MEYFLKGGRARGKTAYFAGFCGGEISLTDTPESAWLCKDRTKAEKERRVLHRLGYYMVIEKTRGER